MFPRPGRRANRASAGSASTKPTYRMGLRDILTKVDLDDRRGRAFNEDRDNSFGCSILRFVVM